MVEKVKNRRLGIGLTIVSACAFGTMATFAAFALEGGASTLTLMLLRFAIASGLLGIIVFAKREPVPRGKVLFGVIVMGAVLYLGQSYTYFTALSLIPKGLAALLLYLYPGIVTLLAWTFLKEHLTRVKLFALALALCGSALAIGPGIGGGNLNTNGILLAALSALFYAVYIVLGSALMRGVTPLMGSWLIMVSTGTAYLGINAVVGFHLPVTALGWTGVVCLAVVSVIAITFFLAGLEHIGPVNSSTISALEPVVTSLLGVVVAGQMLGLGQIFGGVLILAATVILARAAASKALD